jgi:hypothetical protein
MRVHGWSARLVVWLDRGANEGAMSSRILLRLPQPGKAKPRRHWTVPIRAFINYPTLYGISRYVKNNRPIE